MADATEIKFFYEKSNFFRVVHADGVFGGSTPLGYLHLAFYNERHPIPKTTALALVEDGKVSGPEKILDRKEGIFREVEVDVVMDLNVAVAFRGWLDEKIEGLRKHQNINDADWAKILENARV